MRRRRTACRWWRRELLRGRWAGETARNCWRWITADPAEFARRIVVLYRDAALWQTLRDDALARLAAENGREHYVQVLTEILEG